MADAPTYVLPPWLFDLAVENGLISEDDQSRRDGANIPTVKRGQPLPRYEYWLDALVRQYEEKRGMR